VVALCCSITSANASGEVVLDSRGRYMLGSFCSLILRIGKIRRSSRAWSSTESKEVG